MGFCFLPKSGFLMENQKTVNKSPDSCVSIPTIVEMSGKLTDEYSFALPLCRLPFLLMLFMYDQTMLSQAVSAKQVSIRRNVFD
jgi:hypothetical protein